MTSDKRAAASPEHRTVARVMSILELVLASDARGLRLGDLASAIDAPKSSVHILVKGLVAEGYLRVEDNRYLPGPATASLLAAGSTSAAAPYRHTLEELSHQWNETAILATLVGDSLVYIDSVESTEFIRAAPELHRRFELWPRSSGRCLLAFMDGRRLDSYLNRHHSPEESAAIRAVLDKVRETRIGINGLDARSAHLGIATPVITGNGPVTVSITVTGPKSRMEDKIDDIAASMLEAVEKLSRRSILD